MIILVLGGTNWTLGNEKAEYASINTSQMKSVDGMDGGGYAERCKEMKAQKDRMKVKSVYFGSDDAKMESDQQKNFGWKSSSGADLAQKKVDNKALKKGTKYPAPTEKSSPRTILILAALALLRFSELCFFPSHFEPFLFGT
jgi:hypothetical protein